MSKRPECIRRLIANRAFFAVATRASVSKVSFFATTAPAAMARSATAAKAADGANDSTVDANTGRTPLLLVLILPIELSCCHDY